MHRKTLVRFRAIAESLPANEQIVGETEHKKIDETTYAFRLTMSESMIKKTISMIKRTILNQEYLDWLGRQTNKTKEKVRKVNSKLSAISVMYFHIDI